MSVDLDLLQQQAETLRSEAMNEAHGEYWMPNSDPGAVAEMTLKLIEEVRIMRTVVVTKAQPPEYDFDE